MGCDAEKRTVITTRIEAAHVEVPVIIRDDQEISLDKFTFASCEIPHHALLLAEVRICRQFLDLMSCELFVEPDQTIRIVRLMQRFQPLRICMPRTEPCGAVGAGND